MKGFEEDVGTKISFYGFTVNTMKNSLIAYEEYGFTQIPQAKVRPRGLVGEVTPNCPLRLGLPPKPSPHLRSPCPAGMASAFKCYICVPAAGPEVHLHPLGCP